MTNTIIDLFPYIQLNKCLLFLFDNIFVVWLNSIIFSSGIQHGIIFYILRSRWQVLQPFSTMKVVFNFVYAVGNSLMRLYLKPKESHPIQITKIFTSHPITKRTTCEKQLNGQKTFSICSFNITWEGFLLHGFSGKNNNTFILNNFTDMYAWKHSFWIHISVTLANGEAGDATKSSFFQHT